MGALSILRFGWAGYLVTTEGGTKIVVDPYLHGAEGMHSGLPEFGQTWIQG
jgi:L-ascorbate metabolism protein UlaG (beta-lactamase superfamily)